MIKLIIISDTLYNMFVLVVTTVVQVEVVVKVVVVVVEAVPTLAVKYLVWAGAVIDTLVEVMPIEVRTC